MGEKSKFSYMSTYRSPTKIQDLKKWPKQEAFMPLDKRNNLWRIDKKRRFGLGVA